MAKNTRCIKKYTELEIDSVDQWYVNSLNFTQSDLNFEASFFEIRQVLIEIWLFEHEFRNGNFNRLWIFGVSNLPTNGWYQAIPGKSPSTILTNKWVIGSNGNGRVYILCFIVKPDKYKRFDWLISGPSKAVLDCQKGVLDREIEGLL